MAVPALLPSEATALPLGNKRKLSEVIDLTADEDAEAAIATTTKTSSHEPAPSAPPTAEDIDVPEHDDDSDDDDDDDQPMIEDIVDQFEISPYEHDGSMDLSNERVAELRLALRRVGIDRFIADTLETEGLQPRQLGIVFGIYPNLACDEDTYLRILSRAINRAYTRRGKLVRYNTIDDAADLLKRSRNIMVITGAGISTSLGIPDFRSKGTGFYDKIRMMGYEDPEDVFHIEDFKEDPTKFFSLAADILPDEKRYTPTHAFIRLLQDQGRLQTNYTQNIDNIEAVAGIEKDRLIQCHGSFATATCRKCGHQVEGVEIFDDIRAKRVAYCKVCIMHIANSRSQPPSKRVKSHSKSRYSVSDSDEDDDIPQPGVMKPDITFFGEPLPNTFFDRFTGCGAQSGDETAEQGDAHTTDLVIAIGTSLKVAPVSEMPNYLPHAIPHIYISLEPIKHVDFDIQLLGRCDDVVTELCRRANFALTHDMIPADFAVSVTPFEDSKHCWNIEPTQRNAAAAAHVDPLTPVESRAIENAAPSNSAAAAALAAPEPPFKKLTQHDGLISD